MTVDRIESGAPPSLSDRAFGLTMTVFFLMISTIAWLSFGRVLTWALITAAVLATTALVYPALLWPLNRLWCRSVAPRIGALINHLALGFFFFFIMTPAALFMRLIGRDPMTRSFEPSRQSYFEPVQRQAQRENFRDVF